MSKVWYGSLQNRLEENKQFVKEIKVGDGVTEYSYTDRTPYEVIAVRDQKHITIRELTAKRTDNNDMSDAQDYEYISNENNYSCEIVKRGDYWYKTTTLTAEELADMERQYEEVKAKGEKISNDLLHLSLWAAQFDHEKVRAKGKQTKYHKMNISIGHAEKYFDYSF